MNTNEIIDGLTNIREMNYLKATIKSISDDLYNEGFETKDIQNYLIKTIIESSQNEFEAAKRMLKEAGLKDITPSKGTKTLLVKFEDPQTGYAYGLYSTGFSRIFAHNNRRCGLYGDRKINVLGSKNKSYKEHARRILVNVNNRRNNKGDLK